jgi:hypothetical protein
MPTMVCLISMGLSILAVAAVLMLLVTSKTCD